MIPVTPLMPTMILISNQKAQGSRLDCALGFEPWSLCLAQMVPSEAVLKRQRTGSVLCTSCGVLVGVNDDRCYNCNRCNPGLWGFAPALRSLGADLGFGPFVIGTCVTLYVLTLIVTVRMGGNIGMGSAFSLFSPGPIPLFLFGESGATPV